MKITGPFAPWVRGALGGATPGIWVQHGARPSLEVEGRTRKVDLLIKRTVDAAAARFLVDRPKRSRGQPSIVVAETVTEGARRTLEAGGLGYVDGHGNAHIRLPGVFVHTVGGPVSGAEAQPSPTRLSGKAGLVAQALLLEPDREWQITQLVARCQVSAGLVHRVLARLEVAEVVSVRGTGPTKRRHLAHPTALLDLWVEEDEEPRTRATPVFVLPGRDRTLGSQCSERLASRSILHAVTGIAAAATLAPALTSVPVSQLRLGAQVDVDEVLVALSARQVTEGANVLLLQPPTDAELLFRQCPHDTWLAANTRIYLDALRDPRRGAEQAATFREAVLGF
ncbi:MAG: hypothetical protein M3423_00760 [Actinomycetota bacterium]|nr:hypothetical protein [Actinomycetota bacterium]